MALVHTSPGDGGFLLTPRIAWGCGAWSVSPGNSSKCVPSLSAVRRVAEEVGASVLMHVCFHIHTGVAEHRCGCSWVLMGVQVSSQVTPACAVLNCIGYSLRELVSKRSVGQGSQSAGSTQGEQSLGRSKVPRDSAGWAVSHIAHGNVPAASPGLSGTVPPGQQQVSRRRPPWSPRPSPWKPVSVQTWRCPHHLHSEDRVFGGVRNTGPPQAPTKATKAGTPSTPTSLELCASLCNKPKSQLPTSCPWK